MAKLATISTCSFNDQQPGTSGLRKPTKRFLEPNYTENFIQSIISTCVKPALSNHPNAPLVAGGDGRYFVRDCLKKVIIPMCLANDIKHLVIGLNGLISTPCTSYLIRSLKAVGGILLTASHNPGGIDNDFGIKYNCENGGPAPEKVTNIIYAYTKSIKEYQTVLSLQDVDLTRTGSTELSIDGKKILVEIIDTTKEYSKFLRDIFDFGSIQELISGDSPKLKCLISGLNGVMGPYIEEIFCNSLGMSKKSIIQCESLEDFGGHHPDPNLTYAKSLVDTLKNDASFGFGAAFDGDGDRNMILGRSGFFLSPCDSLAIVANNLDAIKFFNDKTVKGMARSMPTSRALDEVCKAKNLDCFEVPTGWKYFGNLMDFEMCSLCGEESFGLGSDHIREKDGVWAVLAFLSILAKEFKSGQSFELKNIVSKHWNTYGRHFFVRFDYENCTTSEGNRIMEKLKTFIYNGNNIGLNFGSVSIEKMDDFSYTDPTDKSISSNKGIRIFLNNGARLVFRLSGTGSNGATLRMYIDQFEKENSHFSKESQAYLKETIDLGIQICGIKEITGRYEPTVIT